MVPRPVNDIAAAKQQREHRLTHHLEGNARDAAAIGTGQFVTAEDLKPPRRLGFGQALAIIVCDNVIR